MSRNQIDLAVRAAVLWGAAGGLSAADILATNSMDGGESGTRLVTDMHGRLLPAGRGFVAAGNFSLTDAQISAAQAAPSAANAALLKSSFRRFGSAARVGLDEFGGIFELSAEGALDQGAVNFAGSAVYLVIGDGETLAASSGLLVYRADATFPNTEELPVTTITLEDPDPSRLLLGAFNQFRATLPGVVNNQPAFNLTGFQKPDYQTWAAQYFAPGTPPEDTGQNADPDGDGLTNLNEYNACTDPTRPEDGDGDGGVDGDEIAFGHDPASAASGFSFGERLAAWWTFEGNVFDVAGCLDLQVEDGAADFPPARAGPGVELPPPASLHSHPAATRILSPIGGGFSVAAWVRPCAVAQTAPGVPVPLLSGGSAWSVRREGSAAAGPLTLGVGSGALTAGPSMPDGQLHHVAVSVMPGRRMELWIDGQKIAAGRQPDALADLGSPVSLLTPVPGGATVYGSVIADEMYFWTRPILRRDTAFLDAHRMPDQPGFALRCQLFGADPANGHLTLLAIGENLPGASSYLFQTSSGLTSWQAVGSPQPHPTFAIDMGPGPLPSSREFFRIVSPAPSP